MPLISALERPRQEDRKFEASSGSRVRLCLTKKMKVRVRDEILVIHMIFPNTKAALLNSKQTGFKISAKMGLKSE